MQTICVLGCVKSTQIYAQPFSRLGNARSLLFSQNLTGKLITAQLYKYTFTVEWIFHETVLLCHKGNYILIYLQEAPGSQHMNNLRHYCVHKVRQKSCLCKWFFIHLCTLGKNLQLFLSESLIFRPHLKLLRLNKLMSFKSYTYDVNLYN